MRQGLVAIVIALGLWACGSSPPGTPAPTAVALTGTVSAVNVGAIANATVKILDGTNAGVTATSDSAGHYAFANLTPGNANLSANASIYDQVILGVLIDGKNTLDFSFSVPACQSNNTGSISFGNRSATASQDIVWDGARLTTLTPGQTSNPVTAAAGVAHTLIFRVAGTSTLACLTSTPVIVQCEKGRIITCSFP